MSAEKKYLRFLRVHRVYADDPPVPTRTKVGIETRSVTSQTTLDVALRAAGGQAVWITPALPKSKTDSYRL